MLKRVILLIVSKIKSLFLTSQAFSSRVEFSTVSRKAKIWRKAVLYMSTIDDYSYIGPRTRFIHAHCGKFCSISGDCAIGMGSHSLKYKSTSPIFTAPKNDTGSKWTNTHCYDEYEEIQIGNDVWIGQRAMVMGGVSIGDGAIVGAGAIVTRDIPPYAVVGGIPAKIIKYRFSEEKIKELLEEKWWDKSDDYLKSHIKDFQQEY